MTKEEQYKHEFYNSFTVGDLSDEGKANLNKILQGITPYNLEYQEVLCTGVDWVNEAFEFEYKGEKYFYKQMQKYDCSADTDHIRCVIEEFLGWLGEVKKLMNRYNAQILNDKGEYHLQFETNSRENFNAMEKLAQKCIDNKPRTNFDRITESEEALAEFIATVSNCEMIDCEDCPLLKANCNSKDGIKEWLQKECENE